jgi:hypothetical protein
MHANYLVTRLDGARGGYRGVDTAGHCCKNFHRSIVREKRPKT